MPEIKRHFASFAEAIREGAKLRPQGFGQLLDRQSGATCVLGAAIHALRGTISEQDVEDSLNMGATHWWLLPDAREIYPYMLETKTRCPLLGQSKRLQGGAICDYPEWHLAELAMHLNDDHGMSREQIADWLYAEEEKLGYETLIETEALNAPEAGRGDRVVTEAQAGVSH